MFRRTALDVPKIAPYVLPNLYHYLPLIATVHHRVNGFLGRYEYQLDEKGRVSLPAAFRREADGDRFVLLQWEAPALTLFPESAWEGVKSRLLEFRRHQPEARDYVRWISSNAMEVSPDKQGRILVPAWLQESASLNGRVLLIGAIDRIELWNPDSFSEAVQNRAGEFGRFAPQIFG